MYIYIYICYSIFLIDPLFRCHFYFPPTHHFSFLPSLPSLHATSLCFPCACLPFCLVSFLPPPLYVAFSLSKDHSFPKHTPTSNAHSLMLCKQVISTTVGSRLYHCAAICSLHFGDNFNVYLIKICQRHSILLASKCPVSNGIFSNLCLAKPALLKRNPSWPQLHTLYILWLLNKAKGSWETQEQQTAKLTGFGDVDSSDQGPITPHMAVCLSIAIWLISLMLTLCSNVWRFHS